MSKKGLSIIEYTVLIIAVIGALLAMQAYVRKAICGRWRQGADAIGFGLQYEPR
jgi:Flp pilus assembly pilin Flp